MHYVTRRSHRMQKHKFPVMWPNTLFYGIRTEPTRAWKIMRRHFTPRPHPNALCDPPIDSDAKTQVRRNMSRCEFYGIYTGPTWAWKIVRRCFMPRTHLNALCDMQIAPDAKTQVRYKVSYHASSRISNGPTWAWKRYVDILCPARTRTHYVTHRSQRMQKHKFPLTWLNTVFMGPAPGPAEHEK
jgi:hypothetical protein